MKPLEWDSRLSVGVAAIDDQHKGLLAIANRALLSVAAKGDGDFIAGIVQELRDYTAVHFHDEEAFMLLYKFPDRTKHMAQHEKLVHQVKDFQKRFYYHEGVTPDEVKAFIKSWLFDHILVWDMQYAKFCCKI